MARRQRRSRAQLALFPDELFAAPAAAPGTEAILPTVPGGAGAAPELDERARGVLPLASAVPTSPGTSEPSPRRPAIPRGLSSADARAMVWLRAKGEPLTAIARQFHTSRAVVLRFIRTPMLIRELEEQEARERRP